MKGGRLAVVIAALVLAPSIWSSPAALATAEDSALIMKRLNEHRTKHGVRRLIRDAEVDKVAQRWAEHMAREGRLSHNPDVGSEIPPWRKWGENVAYGPDAETIFQGWVSSAGHNRNMLDPEFTRVGIGTAWSGNTLYAVQDFMTPLDGETDPEPPEDSPPPPPAERDPITELVCSITWPGGILKCA